MVIPELATLLQSPSYVGATTRRQVSAQQSSPGDGAISVMLQGLCHTCCNAFGESEPTVVFQERGKCKALLGSLSVTAKAERRAGVLRGVRRTDTLEQLRDHVLVGSRRR